MKKYIATANIVSLAFMLLVAIFTTSLDPDTLSNCYTLLGLSWMILLVWSTVLLLRKK